MKNVMEIVEGLYPDFGNRLVNEDESVCARQAETNAVEFSCDDGEIKKARLTQYGEIEFTARLTLSGKTREDASWCGDELYVNVEARAVLRDGEWQVESWEVKSVESNFDESFTR